MFKTRLLSGIILVILALILIITGGPILAGALFLISLIGMNELYKVLQAEGKGQTLLNRTGYLAAACYYLLVYFTGEEYLFLFATCSLIVLMAVYVFSYPRFVIVEVMGSYFALLYAAVMLSFIYQLRVLENGRYLVWLVFLASWGSDTCAYCVGKLFGKHKMTPLLSPKKSVEGGIGGVAGAALLGMIYAAVLSGPLHAGTYSVLMFALICAIGALISMVGDLAASAIKRNYNIKDYGTLIPGHGGIMDRFDSVIFIAPVMFYLCRYLL